MPLIAFEGKSPRTDSSCFIAPDSWIIGDVEIGNDSSVFFYCVLRGDIQPIRIGSRTNIQEHSLLHTSHGMSPVIVGDNVTVGHRAILHGCTVGNNSLIGMGATVLDDATIGENSIVGAHSLVTKGTIIPPQSLVVGTPAKVVRSLTATELDSLKESANHYVELANEYRLLLPTSDKSSNCTMRD